MSTKPLAHALMQEAVNALAAHKGNSTHAALALKLPRETFRSRVRSAVLRGVGASSAPADEAKKPPELDTTPRHKELAALPKKAIRRYVVTAAQNATPVHGPFLAALKVYCETNRAELVVIPYLYKNPTSIYSENAKEQAYWAKETLPYLLNKRIQLNKNLVVMADIAIQPTAVRPLQGFDTITGELSGIFAHAKIELVTVPTPQKKLPKILTTTGACTKPNYTASKAGKKGDFHHTLGACVVEIDGDAFHMRQLVACTDGSFMDLEHEYCPDGKFPIDGEYVVEALVMGDTHEEFVDPDVVSATFGKSGVVETLNPRYVVWHDIHDFYARNHHHKNAVFVNYVKHKTGMANVERGLDKTFAFVDAHPHSGTNVFVPSNHPDALNRWVQETDPRDDPENAVFWAQTFVACCEGAYMSNTGVKTIDPFVYWAKRKMASADKAIFLGRDESFMIKNIEVTYHGDKGPNGSRGSIGGFTKIGPKAVIGHSHTPGIRDGVYQVGLNARYGLEYASGPSSWLQTDCVIYKNGKRSLINFIAGAWRA